MPRSAPNRPKTALIGRRSNPNWKPSGARSGRYQASRWFQANDMPTSFAQRGQMQQSLAIAFAMAAALIIAFLLYTKVFAP